MFQIYIHATGSKGNAYTIQDGGHKILIDPGIRFKELMKKTGHSLTSYDFVLLSHEHKDHSKAIPELLRIGKHCYMSQGTRDDLELMHSSALIIESEMEFERDRWKVLPFEVYHDAAEPLGFLIISPSGKKILYATDTAFIKYRFEGVTHYMIECNYRKELLEKNTTLTAEVKRRIEVSHFELSRVVDFFMAQDLSKTEAIYLIHLSDDNSDEKLFKAMVEEVTGKPVFV